MRHHQSQSQQSEREQKGNEEYLGVLGKAETRGDGMDDGKTLEVVLMRCEIERTDRPHARLEVFRDGIRG